MKKNNKEKLELITGIEKINPEALEELSNGLDPEENIEECVALAVQHIEIVGANAANNHIFSSLCDVIIPSPNYNPRSDAAKFGVTNNKIDRITIHHMAGNLTVEACGNMFASPSRQASSNYGIGTDGRAAGYVGEENRSWCSGSRNNDFRAITIEMANDTFDPTWTVSQAALTKLYSLLVDICKRNNIPRLVYSDNKNDRINNLNGCNISWHSDFANTGCASPYIKSIIKDIVTVVNNRLGAEPTPTPQPEPTPQPTPTPIPSIPSGTPDPYADYSKPFWDFFRILGMPEYGVAGLIGNISCESAIRPNNLQNSYERKLGLNDNQYTAAVDNGTYTNFAKDSAGYGLAQWTSSGRKQGLLDLAKQCKMSICDINLQLTYLTNELQNKYKNVWDGLFAAKSVAEASNLVLLQYERPADQSVSAQQRRASYGQNFYNKFAGSAVTTTFPIVATTQKTETQATPVQTTITAIEPYQVKITTMMLNVRSGAGLTYPVKTSVKKNEVYTIVDERNGWGKLKSGAGWIDLKYTKRIY